MKGTAKWWRSRNLLFALSGVVVVAAVYDVAILPLASFQVGFGERCSSSDWEAGEVYFAS
jgi:hypothetical protein